ncbi:MAG: protein kinase [Planctomycetes bacterium]|nr:protein kinase [Planctomycetota bacterium]
MSESVDEILVQRVLEAGLLDEARLREILRRREAESAAGRPPRFLGKVLVEEGSLTSAQLFGLLGTDLLARLEVQGDDRSATLVDGPQRAAATDATLPADGTLPAEAIVSSDPAALPRLSPRPPAPAPGPFVWAPLPDADARSVPPAAALDPAAEAPLRPSDTAPLPAEGSGSDPTLATSGSLPTRFAPTRRVTARPAPSGPRNETLPLGPRWPTPPSTTLPAGEHFGRYVLESEIARGAMGIVYRAFDTQLRRTVALKLMLGSASVPDEARARFQREASMAARLDHPNIVPVYEASEHDGKLYYTMALIEGESLHDILKRLGALPPRVALKIARDAARALQHAHDQRMVHRDVKPANLLICASAPDLGADAPSADTALSVAGTTTSSFRVLVSDFGIAKDANGETLMTRPGSVLGTPMYMSPEQARGDLERVGPVSDEYSLGAILYQMLSGRPPLVEASAPLMLEAVIRKDPLPLRARRPDLHPDLETVVSKAMEKEPGRRYPTIGGMADDLDRYLAGEIIRARPATWLYRMRRRVARHREAALVLAGVSAVGAVLFGLFVLAPRVAAWRAERRARAERSARESAAAARLRAAQERLDAGQGDAAVLEAKGLVTEFEAYAKAGEAVCIPQAHGLLARAYAARQDRALALQESMEAYRATVGSPDAGRYIVQAARELIAQLRPDDAQALLARIPSEARTEALLAEAAYWQGRASEASMDFAGAAARLAEAQKHGRLPPELVPACEEHLAFCRGFARRVRLEVRARDLAVADVDGDGRPDLVGIDEEHVFFGHVEGERWVERARVKVETGGKFTLGHLALARFGGTDRPTLLAGGGDRGRGAGGVWFLRAKEGGLVEAASLKLDLEVGPIASGDIDGDGKPEVAITTRGARPQVLVYRWAEGTAPRLLAALSCNGELNGVDLVDLDGDKRAELVVFEGEWNEYGVFAARWDAAAGRLAPGLSVRLGVPLGFCRVDRDGAPPAYLVGAGWERRMVHPLRKMSGAEKFAAEYRSPGVYLLEPKPGPTFDVRAVAARSWQEGDSGRGHVQQVRGASGDMAWCCVSSLGIWSGGWENHRDTTLQVYRTGVYDKPFATLVPWTGAPGPTTGLPWRSLDVDGDGREEPVYQADGGLIYLAPLRGAGGAGRASAAGKPGEAEGAGAADSTDPTASSIGENPDFAYAEAAERVGLAEQALAGYAKAEAQAKSPADYRAAVRGRLSCLSRLGRAAELAAAAEDAAEREPFSEIALLEEGLRRLDEGGHWAEAAGLATRLLRSVGLDAGRRATATQQAACFRGLDALPGRVRLVGPGAAAAVDWLATAPFPFARDKDGAWTVHAETDGQDRLLVPLSPGVGAWRLCGTLRAVAHPWAVVVRAGVTQSSPIPGDGSTPLSPAVGFAARGERNFPLYFLDVSAPNALGWNAPILERDRPWERPLGFALTHVPHQHRLFVSVDGAGPASGAARASGDFVAELGVGSTLFAGLECAGEDDHAIGPPGVFRLEEFELQTATDGARSVPYEAKSAAQTMLLANGRWARGDGREALPLYERATRMADLDREREDAARAKGLPSRWDGAGPYDVAVWAFVDARFYGGLLRAALDDAPGAARDLDAAWGLSSVRCRDLIRRYAVPLGARAKERAALAALWARTPEDAGLKGNPLARAASAMRVVGIAGAELLIPEVRIDLESFLGVAALEEGGAAARAGVRGGDVVIAVDDLRVQDPSAFQGAVSAAARAGRRSVTLVVNRQGRMLTLEAPTQDLKLGFQQFQAPVPRPR